MGGDTQRQPPYPTSIQTKHTLIRLHFFLSFQESQLTKNGLLFTHLECKNSATNQHITIHKRRSCISVEQKCSNLVTNALEDATTDRPTNDDQAKYKLNVQSPYNGPPFNLKHNAVSFLFYLCVVTYCTTHIIQTTYS